MKKSSLFSAFVSFVFFCNSFCGSGFWFAGRLVHRFRIFVQRRGQRMSLFRLVTGHRLMHHVGAKVNPARPFHTAEVRIDSDGIEDFCVQQLQKHAAAPFGFDSKNATQTVIESDFQSAAGQRFSGNNPIHALILPQWRDFGRLLIVAGQISRPPRFRAMQRRPFEDKRLRPPAHAALNDFECVDIHLDFLALINRVKM